jgi:hypothetical protein
LQVRKRKDKKRNRSDSDGAQAVGDLITTQLGMAEQPLLVEQELDKGKGKSKEERRRKKEEGAQ